jgi:hypothetical protein
MSLATIFAVCLLVASPVMSATKSSALQVAAQDTQPAQDSNQTVPPPDTSTPSGQGNPEPPSAPPQTSASGTQSEKAQPDSTAKKPPTAPATRKRRRKPKPTIPAGLEPGKTVVHNGSTTDPKAQIAPSVTTAQASRQRQNTTQLLASTDANLKQLSGRQLTPGQQDTMKQIQAYMEQAKAADAAGDLQSAHNLAVKAHLLSDDLSKH